MARVDKIRLVRRTDPTEFLNVTAADYAANIAAYRDWRLVSEDSAGSREDNAKAIGEAEGEAARRRRGEDEALARAQAERSSRRDIQTGDGDAPAPAEPERPDIDSMSGSDMTRWLEASDMEKPAGWAHMSASKKREAFKALFS